MDKTTLLSANQLLKIFSSSHIATAIYTTNDLVIEAVTDAMLEFWGKDRSIVGQPLAVAVPELVGQPFIGQMQEVLKTGITASKTSEPAILKIDDELQTRYFDYEYKALGNEEGENFCVLHYASDVTERVLGLVAIENEELKRIALESEQAMNEELMAANEELSATNEELYQTQQTLHELNQELENRVAARTRDLSDSERRLRYLIDDAPVAIAVFNGRDLRIESANQHMLQIWGKSNKVVGETLKMAVPELKGQPFIALLSEVMISGKPYIGNEMSWLLEYEGQLKEIYTNFVCKPLKNDNGITEGIMVVATEITEQVHARRAVEEAKFRLQAMVENTPVAMAIFTGEELKIEQANEAMIQDTWKRQAEDVIGKPLLEVFPELLYQQFPQLLRNVFTTGRKIAMPEVAVDLGLTDGSISKIYVNFSYDPLKNSSGEVEAIMATVINITDTVRVRKELEISESALQDTTEALAATNEEITAINEEMAASYEELLSTNEELVETKDHLSLLLHKITASEDRFRFLLNAMPQQVWTADAGGTFNYLNERVLDDLGVTSDLIMNEGWLRFIHPDDYSHALATWKESLKTGNEYLAEIRLLFFDGNYRWHLSRALPLIENGVITLWVGTSTDIDLQKNNEQKKDEFISIASHELKTPLTSIKAFNQLMKRTIDPEKLSGFVGKSTDNIRRLEKLISDLLDVTKLNAGKVEYNMELFDFKRLLTDSVESAGHIYSSHEILLESTADIELMGDHFRLEQVLNNFLTNAVKYSPDGKRVLVNSRLENGHVVVSVQDFGIGIAPGNINKLFDRYFRVDSTAMRFEGLGLGLFISSEILKRHRGKMWIESELGKGSVFYFMLPVLVDRESYLDEITDESITDV